jgi:glycosyltransferase involved in cell wall biosynthesis
MRVLHVYRTYFPETQGGLEEVIRQICSNTLEHGIESRVFTLSNNKTNDVIQFEGVDVYRFPITTEIASCGFSIAALKGFKESVAWADIIHYHFPWPFGDLLHLFAKVNKPTIVTYHSDVVRQKWLLKLYRPVMNLFLDKVDAIVATSGNYFATSDVLGHYSEKTQVIPIGINDHQLNGDDQQKIKHWKNEVGEGFFLFIGVLRYYKGLHILMDALQNTECRVVIVGSGPVEQELREHAKRLNLTNVIFLGYVSDEDKIALIKLSIGIVFPSYLRSEAYGVTLLEGALHGKPLISTEIGSGTSYVNSHGVTGLVIPPSDPRSLRQAMETITNDKDLAKEMGINARKRYELLFTGSLMGEKYAQLYQQIDRDNHQ